MKTTKLSAEALRLLRIVAAARGEKFSQTLEHLLREELKRLKTDKQL